jgi:hypothetical protein
MPFLALSSENSLPKDAKPLAIVRSSDPELDGQVLGLYSGHETEPQKKSKAPAPRLEYYEHDLKKICGAAHVGQCFAALLKALRTGAEPEDVPEELRDVFARICADAAGPKIGSNVSLSVGSSFELLPQTDPTGERQVGYLAGPAGCGKSFAAAQYAQKYHALYPKRPIFFWTANDISADRAWASLLKKKALTLLDPKTLFDAPMDVARDFPTDEGGSLSIWDDCIDAYSGKQEKAVLLAVQNQLQLGRKFGQSVLVISHELTNYSKTRAILHDSHWVCVFPALCPPHSLKFFLNKIGVDEKMIGEMRKWGRACYISMRAPQWAVSENTARLLTE